MKQKLPFLAGAVLSSVVALSAWAQTEAPIKLDPVAVEAARVIPGAEIPFDTFIRIEVRNFQDESLGRIVDLGIDLINGRIVEALVESDTSLDVGNKVVAVPPLALYPDLRNRVYRLNISAAQFKTAAAIDLSTWVDSGRSDRVAAAYRLFGQEIYFLEEGETASTTDSRPKVLLGYVERCSKILDLPVDNFQNEKLGKVWSLTMDIPKGRIRSVIVIAPGNFQTKSIIPAMALSFNATRDGLLLDNTKLEMAAEPRFIFTAAVYGNEAYSTEEPYTGPRTKVALVQGHSYRDVDQTVLINKDIRAAGIDRQHVEIATINDRVTLRGWVNTAEEKRRIGEIAIAASRLELVDNQITVGKPTSDQ